MIGEPPISDELAQWMSASDGKLELSTTEIRSVGLELLRHRAMLRRVEAVCARLEDRKQDPTSQMWAAELRAAITGRKWLYRCPVHGDRVKSHKVQENSVCCSQAVLVGEVETP